MCLCTLACCIWSVISNCWLDWEQKCKKSKMTRHGTLPYKDFETLGMTWTFWSISFPKIYCTATTFFFSKNPVSSMGTYILYTHLYYKFRIFHLCLVDYKAHHNIFQWKEICFMPPEEMASRGKHTWYLSFLLPFWQSNHGQIKKKEGK